MNSERTWSLILSAFLIYVLAVGGVSDGQPALVLLLRVFSIGLLVAGLFRLRDGNLGGSTGPGLIIIAMGGSLLLLHLLPLPPVVWQAFPGREFVSAAITAAGAAPKWMPLSLSPPLTRLSILALLPPLAAFTACLTLVKRERWTPIIAFLAVVVASIVLGFVQRFQGINSPFYFYEHTNVGAAIGTFANRNFFAALQYVAIPLTWALALHTLRDGRVNRYVVIGFSALMLMSIILGLAVTGSRAGVILGMVALLGSSFLTWGQQKSTSVRLGSRYAITALIVAFLIVGQFGMVAVLRLAELDPVSDLRTLIFGTTLRAAWTYFPVGSGFGTFVPIYAMHETPPTMIDAYVNHAHNDWLELWLEGGLPSGLILAAFVCWYVSSSIRVWGVNSEHANLLPKASTLAAGLLLIHSLIDYPLRTPALASLFGILTGFIATAPIGARVRRRNPNSQRTAPLQRVVRRAAPVFAPRNARPSS